MGLACGILLLPMASRTYYRPSWEQPGRKIPAYKRKFPFHNCFSLEEVCAVGCHYLASHVLLSTCPIVESGFDVCEKTQVKIEEKYGKYWDEEAPGFILNASACTVPLCTA